MHNATEATNMTNSTNITDDQIRALRDEAVAAGDRIQEALCRLALLEAPNGSVDALLDSSYAECTSEEAREACADAIAAAEAMAD